MSEDVQEVRVTTEELAEQCSALANSVSNCVRQWGDEHQGRTSGVVAGAVIMRVMANLVRSSLPEDKAMSSASRLLGKAFVDHPGELIKEAVTIMQENGLAAGVH